MSVRDVGLFLRGARTDAAIRRDRGRDGDRAAFNAAYASGDPWGSRQRPGFRYQRRKYDHLAALLPPGLRFREALDIGSGLGLLGQRVARRAEAVLGLDISDQAVERANALHRDVDNLRFEQGDVRSLPTALNGRFDLVVIADTLCYLPLPITDAVLNALASRVAALLAPGGLCLIANSYFFDAHPDSRLTRRIHDAFAASRGFRLRAEYRRPFYLASLLETDGASSALGEKT